jgi:hypothetical protein
VEPQRSLSGDSDVRDLIHDLLTQTLRWTTWQPLPRLGFPGTSDPAVTPKGLDGERPPATVIALRRQPHGELGATAPA